MNLNGYQQTVRVIRIEKKLKSIMPLGSGSQILLGQVGRRLVWALTHWANKNENLFVLDNHKDVYRVLKIPQFFFFWWEGELKKGKLPAMEYIFPSREVVECSSSHAFRQHVVSFIGN